MAPSTDPAGQAAPAGPARMRRWSTPRDLPLGAGFALVFWAAAELGALLTVRASTYVSVWLPAGIYVATLLILPRARWPAIVLGALLGNVAFDARLDTPALAIAGFALANTTQALLGAWLTARLVGPRPRLANLTEFGGLMVATAVIAPAVSALLGAGVLRAAALAPAFASAFWGWWGSNAMATLLVLPAALAWLAPPRRPLPPVSPRRLLEGGVMLAALAGATYYLLVLDRGILAPYKSRLFPFLLWAAIRFGLRGATLVNLAFALLVALLTTFVQRGLGPAEVASGEYVLGLQTFVAMGALVGILPAIALGERDRTLSALEREHRQLEAIVNASMDAIITIDEHDRIVVWSRAAERVFGCSSEAAVGQPLDRFIPDHLGARASGFVRRADGPPQAQGDFAALHGRRPHGDALEEFPLEASLAAIEVGEQRLFAITCRDVSERNKAHALKHRLEAQLRQAQKLEAIGTLAGGIAHDFNNILGVILGNVALARLDVGSGHPADESLGEIDRAGRRATQLVQQILMFSRQQETTRRAIALPATVNEALKMLRATLPAQVDLVLEVAADVPPVLADPTQVHQILINLCTNAWQAFDDAGAGQAGRIFITIDAVTVAGEASPTDAPSGRYARLCVRDDGTGMSPSTLDRAFEPFFTTKGPGMGTGLGLSVVHGIVKDHGGFICVTSQTGAGTTFEILLPATTEPVALVREEPPAPLPRGRGQRVLYLDDEPPLVELAQRLLGRMGYRIVGFTRPQEALDALRDDPRAFDLVLTDFNMPGMSGVEVARTVAALRPDLPVVLASGYITEELRESAARAGVRHLIYKPNTVEELCAVVHQILRQPDAAADITPR